MTCTRRTLFVAGTAAALAAPRIALAAWPADRPIEVIVPYPPGGGVDTMARMILPAVQNRLPGARFVVVNRAGAGGQLGWEAVFNAAPDGFTLAATSVPALVTYPMERAVRYRPLDFTYIANVVDDPGGLFVGANSPLRTLADLVAAAKARPGEISYGTTGIGSDDHLLVLGLEDKLSLPPMTHVPFKGNAPAMAELMANRVAILFDLNTTAVAQVQSGSVRALALTSPTRNKKLPDTPTMVEAGYPDFNFEGWIGLLAPAQTPPDVVDALAQANQKIVADASFVADMENSGYDLDPVSVAELKKRIAYDYEFFKKLAPDVQASQ